MMFGCQTLISRLVRALVMQKEILCLHLGPLNFPGKGKIIFVGYEFKRIDFPLKMALLNAQIPWKFKDDAMNKVLISETYGSRIPFFMQLFAIFLSLASGNKLVFNPVCKTSNSKRTVTIRKKILITSKKVKRLLCLHVGRLIGWGSKIMNRLFCAACMWIIIFYFFFSLIAPVID